MPVVTPPSITGLPTPPDPADRSTFNTRAYPWAAALPTFGTELSALADNVADNATDAAASAVTAAGHVTDAETARDDALQAQAAAEAASAAAKWVSGTTYAQGDVVWSPVDFASYRRKIAGAGATDPSADATNWQALIASGVASLTRSARTSNTALAIADKGKLIDVTSGTFTQTFNACATLLDGWFVYLRNSGTGDITLDPNGSETIDGLTSFVMYPGEVRLIQCDGTALRSVALSSFSKTFTTTGTFTKPPGYAVFEGLLWGGGGSGAAYDNRGSGGGGGACVPFIFAASALDASEYIVIGAGGPGVGGGAGADGWAGGTSSIGTKLYAYGGAFGNGPSGNRGGGGGGSLSAGNTSGQPNGGKPENYSGSGSLDSPGFGGGAGSGSTQSSGGASHYGGGGGAHTRDSAPYTCVGGSSVYGGGGGGNGGYTTNTYNGAGGASTFGGAGGAGSYSGNGTAGTAPGGGGGGASQAANTSGAGARGELRIWGVM